MATGTKFQLLKNGTSLGEVEVVFEDECDGMRGGSFGLVANVKPNLKDGVDNYELIDQQGHHRLIVIGQIIEKRVGFISNLNDWK